MGDQEGELGRELAKRAQGRSGARPSMEVVDLGPSSLGLEVGLKGKKRRDGLYTQGTTVGLNLKLKEVMGEVAGPEAGPSRKWWTAEEESPSRDGVMDLDDSPSKSMLQGTNKGHQMKVSSLAIPSSNSKSNTEEEIFKYWVTEDVRKQNMKILHSATDSTLVEEALRYGSVSLLRGERVSGSSHLFLFFLIGLRRGSIAIVQDQLGRGLSLRCPCVFYRETEQRRMIRAVGRW